MMPKDFAWEEFLIDPPLWHVVCFRIWIKINKICVDHGYWFGQNIYISEMYFRIILYIIFEFNRHLCFLSL